MRLYVYLVLWLEDNHRNVEVFDDLLIAQRYARALNREDSNRDAWTEAFAVRSASYLTARFGLL